MMRRHSNLFFAVRIVTFLAIASSLEKPECVEGFSVRKAEQSPLLITVGQQLPQAPTL
jgi:hypothetical protein